MTQGEGAHESLVGWLLVGTGVFDFLLAAFFYFVRKPPDERARKILPLALIIGGIALGGIGVLFLAGVLPPR